MKFVKVTTENEVSIVDLPGTDHNAIAASIGADLIQHVRINHTQGIRDWETGRIVILCDEEGLFKENNRCNPVASILYGTLDHGHPIVGDVLLARIDKNNPEQDFEDMTPPYARKMVDCMNTAIRALAQSGLSEILHTRYDNSKAQPPVIMSLEDYLEIMDKEENQNA